MTAKQPLDRKVRWIFAAIILMILAVPVMAVWSYIDRVTAGGAVASVKSTDDRLVSIGKSTMLLEPGELGRAMTDWLRVSKEETLEFELSDRSFVPGSAEPSPTGATRVSQIVQLANMHPLLMVHILIPTQVASSTMLALDQQRATRFRDKLVNRGVNAARVTIGGETDDLPTAQSPQIAVLLTK